MTSETWKAWPEDEAMEASDLGRVRRLGRVLTQEVEAAYVAGSVKTGMYPSVRWTVGGKRKRAKVHRIVCDAWLGRLPDGYHRAHINGDPTDNRLCNLELVPPWVNMVEHRAQQGRSPIWRLTSEQLQSALARYAEPGVTAIPLEREMGLGVTTMHYHIRQAGVSKRGKISDAQATDAARRINDGETFHAVAKSLGVTGSGLTHRLRRMGLISTSPRPPSVRKAELAEAIKADRARGDKVLDIALRHGVSVATVSHHVGQRGQRSTYTTGQRRDEIRAAALTMTIPELTRAFDLHPQTARYQWERARDKAQEAASQHA